MTKIVTLTFRVPQEKFVHIAHDKQERLILTQWNCAWNVRMAPHSSGTRFYADFSTDPDTASEIVKMAKDSNITVYKSE